MQSHSTYKLQRHHQVHLNIQSMPFQEGSSYYSSTLRNQVCSSTIVIVVILTPLHVNGSNPALKWYLLVELGHSFGLVPQGGRCFFALFLSHPPPVFPPCFTPSLLHLFVSMPPPATSSSSAHHILLPPPPHLSHLLRACPPFHSCLCLLLSYCPQSSLAGNTEPEKKKRNVS